MELLPTSLKITSLLRFHLSLLFRGRIQTSLKECFVLLFHSDGMGTCCWARRPSSSTLVKILFIDLLKYISFKSPPRSTAVDFHSEERRSGVGMEFVCDQRVLDTRVVSPSLGRLEFILFEFLEKTRRSTVGFFTRRSGTQRTGWRLCVTKGFQIHSGNFSSTCLFQIRLVQIFFQDLECVCTREQRSGGRDGVCV